MSTFEWIAIAIVASLSSARITRLIVWDSYPPSVWVRMKWDALTNDGPWATLVHCGYCFGPYASAAVLLSGWLSNWHTAWWLVNTWLALGYVAAMIMAYDGED